MRSISLFLVLCLVFCFCAVALAQNNQTTADQPSPEVVGQPNPPPPPPDNLQAPPPAPAPPAPPRMPQVHKPAPPVVGPAPVPNAAPPAPITAKRDVIVIVGPLDSIGNPMAVQGKVVVIVRPAVAAKVRRAELFLDEKTPIAFRQGFMTDLDTTALTAGVHILKAVGYDAAGKRAWTASTQIEAGGKKPAAVAPKPAPAVKPVAPKSTASVKPVQTPAPTGLGKTFVSAKYGFSIRYPAGWTTSDKTPAMKPKQPGNGWIAFTTKKSNLVVNVRRMRLEPKTDAEAFAKYNPYVTKWDRKTIGDAQAFATNTDDGNRIIHRLIIIKKGYAWMLNCVDSAGKTSDAGQKLFDAMVGSFTVSGNRSVEPQPGAKKRMERNLRAVAKAIAKYQKQPAKPTAKLSPKTTAKPVAKAAPKPAAKTVVTAPAKPMAKPIAKPVTKPAAPKAPKKP